MAVTTDVQVAASDADIPQASEIHSWIELAVAASGRAPDDSVEVAVRVVDADEIRTLNRLYRDKDAVTNVLSFPVGQIDGLPEGESRLLGDVVICASVVSDEADKQGKDVAAHWGHMIVHGTLHLLGFDHENDADAAAMESLETKILASRNVTDPYAGPA